MTDTRPIVAVVENDPAILKAIERLLIAYEYKAEIFSSAEMYLQREQNDEVKCLVLDINLGGISGIELQKRLRAMGSTLPIIFISGRSDTTTRSKAIDMGCVAFLHKPFESSALRSALDIATGKKQATGI